MGQLTEKQYWDSIHKAKVAKRKRYFVKRNLKILATRLFENEFVRCYADYLLWDIIYKEYLPKTKGAKILEVGSAPGNNLVRLSQRFGFIPYGVEYSESGVELNRKVFILNNINPNNVIHADFLSDDFQKQYSSYFDAVISAGLIEHFEDVGDIVEKHINLLTEGGYLIVSIPNLRGANYVWQWLFNKDLLPMHNIDIMQKRKFSKIFNKVCLSTLFCDYYGVFNFGLFVAKENSPLRFVLTCCKILQLILNLVFRLLFRKAGAESRLFSPYLLFIGVKKR
ncbi:MAG: class I SAM-dependent methyltransferase [Sedimentisphaerales bacterium]